MKDGLTALSRHTKYPYVISSSAREVDFCASNGPKYSTEILNRSLQVIFLMDDLFSRHFMWIWVCFWIVLLLHETSKHSVVKFLSRQRRPPYCVFCISDYQPLEKMSSPLDICDTEFDLKSLVGKLNTFSCLIHQ